MKKNELSGLRTPLTGEGLFCSLTLCSHNPGLHAAKRARPNIPKKDNDIKRPSLLAGTRAGKDATGKAPPFGGWPANLMAGASRVVPRSSLVDRLQEMIVPTPD